MTLKHLRSSTANKRPQASGMADGQLAINTASGSPGLFFKDAGGHLVKIGPVHVGSGAPNASPASGGTSGNAVGEQWLDNSGGTYVFKVWDGIAWRSESGEFVNASGDTMTGSLTMGPAATLIFEGSTDDGFETTLTVVNPTADQIITLPNITGTVVTTGDTGTVTSTMIADGAIVNADVNASAAIDYSKLANITAGRVLLGNASNVPTATALTGDVTISSSGVTAISAGVIDNADISATAAIVDTKLGTISTADKVSISALNIDGGTDIGAALADADLFIVDDGGAGTNRKAAATRITDYAFGKVSGDIAISSAGVAAIGAGAIVDADINASAAIVDTKLATISTANKVGIGSLDIDGSTDIGAALADADLIIVDDGGGGTNRKSAVTRIPVYTFSKVSGDVTVDSSGVASIASGVIVNADINASAAIVDTKLATISTAGKVANSATTATSANTASSIVARDASGNFTAGTITASSFSGPATSLTSLPAGQLTGTIPSAVLGNSSNFVGTTSIALNRASANQGLTGISSLAMPGVTAGTITLTPAASGGTVAITVPATAGTLVTTGDSGTVTSTMIANDTIVNADVNASAAIAGTKISPNFGSQDIVSTGTSTAASFIPTSSTAPANGLYLSAANTVALATNSTGKLFVDSAGKVSIVGSSIGDGLNVTGSVLASSSPNWNYPGLIVKRTASNVATAKQISFLLDGDAISDTTLTNYLNIWGTYSGAPTTGSTSSGLSAAMNIGAPNAIIAHTNGNERVRITSSGFVGVGVNAPVAKFQINTQDGFRFDVGANSYSYMQFGSAASGEATGEIGFERTTGNIYIKRGAPSSPSTALTIDVNRNIGIATVNPSALLHAAGVVRVGANDATDAVLEIGAGATGNRNAYIDLTGDTTYSDFGLRLARGNTGADATSELRHRGTGALNLIAVDSGSVTFRTVDIERGRFDSSGRLLLGTNLNRNSRVDTTGFSSLIQIESNSEAAQSITRWSADASASRLHLQKGRGTIASPTTIVTGDTFGDLSFSGYDGFNMTNGARITASAEGTVASGVMPGRLAFWTTASGGSSPTERMRITSSGFVGINSTNPVYPLHVEGSGANPGRVYLGNSLEALASGVNNGGAIYFGVNPTSATLPTAAIETSWGGATNPQIHMGISRDGNKTRFSAFSDFTARIYTGNNERVRIDSNGQFNLASNAGAAPFVANIGGSEVARISGSSQLLIGTSTDVNVRGLGHRLQISGNNFTSASQVISRHSADANAPGFEFAKNRGSSALSLTTVSDGDALGNLIFSGADGSGYVQAAQIVAQVDGTPGTNDMPGRIVLSTTADGASLPTERLRIDQAGRVAIGTGAPDAGATLHLAKIITGATTAYGVLNNNVVQSGVTSDAQYFNATANTAATAFTLTNLRGYHYRQATIGSGSIVTNQFGFFVESDVIGATNNYGFYGNIASGANRWNFYANGTANNYFRGNVGIGVATPGEALEVTGNIRVSANAGSFRNVGAANGSNTSLVLAAGSTSGEGGNIELGRNNDNRYDANEHIFRTVSGSTETARIDSSNRFLIGTPTPYTISGLATPDAQLSKAGQDSTFAVTAWKGDSIGFNPTLQLMRSYNNTAGTHTAVPDGARLGSIRFAGSNGTAFFSGAEIIANAQGQTWASGDCPGSMTFATTADGATSPTPRMTITASGYVGVGTSLPDTLFTCSGADNAVLAGFKAVNGALTVSPFETGNGVKVTARNGSLSGFETLSLQASTHYFVVGFNRAMTIAPSLNVGVGTTAPSGNLHVVNIAGGTARIRVGDGVNNSGIEFNAAGTRIDTPTTNALATYTSDIERLRVTSDGVQCYNQPAPVNYATGTTLTASDLKTGIIRYTGAAASLVLPAGSGVEVGIGSAYDGITFEWSVINTGTGACTVSSGVNHTIVGNGAVAAGSSGRFASRRTSFFVFTSYRLS